MARKSHRALLKTLILGLDGSGTRSRYAILGNFLLSVTVLAAPRRPSLEKALGISKGIAPRHDRF